MVVLGGSVVHGSSSDGDHLRGAAVDGSVVDGAVSNGDGMVDSAIEVAVIAPHEVWVNSSNNVSVVAVLEDLRFISISIFQ